MFYTNENMKFTGKDTSNSVYSSTAMVACADFKKSAKHKTIKNNKIFNDLLREMQYKQCKCVIKDKMYVIVNNLIKHSFLRVLTKTPYVGG